jgi:hypothetical protein
MRPYIVFACSLFLAATAAVGFSVFTGVPGARDYVPSNQPLAFATGIMLVLAVCAGVAGLLLYAREE